MNKLLKSLFKLFSLFLNFRHFSQNIILTQYSILYEEKMFGAFLHNRLMSYKSFVQATIKGISTGDEPPEYFGCLKKLILSTHPLSLLPEDFINQNDISGIDHIEPQYEEPASNQKSKEEEKISVLESKKETIEEDIPPPSLLSDDAFNENSRSRSVLETESKNELHNTESSFESPSWASPVKRGNTAGVPSDNEYIAEEEETIYEIDPTFIVHQFLTQCLLKIRRQSIFYKRFIRKFQVCKKDSPEYQKNLDEFTKYINTGLIPEKTVDDKDLKRVTNTQPGFSLPPTIRALENTPRNPIVQIEELFGKIAKETYPKYWPQVTTILPRIQTNSKIMVSFKRSRYSKLLKIMEQKFEKKEAGRLSFKRIVSSEEEDFV